MSADTSALAGAQCVVAGNNGRLYIQTYAKASARKCLLFQPVLCPDAVEQVKQYVLQHCFIKALAGAQQ